ncbi:hypothetical protein D9M71_773740 [compost metagenome]
MQEFFDRRGQLVEDVFGDNRHHGEADADGDDVEVAPIGHEIHLRQDFHACRRDHAEHHDGSAADDVARDRSANEGNLRQRAEQDQDDAARRHHEAAEHAGDLEKADILRIGRVGEGIEEAADNVPDTVGS